MTSFKRTLLVVDDDSLFADALMDYFSSARIEAFTASSLREARAILTERPVDVVLLDQHLPDGDGTTLCPEILQASESAKIVFVTAWPSFDNALEAIRLGAFDYLCKPCDPAQVRLAVDRALRTLELERAESLGNYRRARQAGESVFVGESAAAAEVRALARRAAACDAPVLLTGETGTGKGLVARAIHFASPRSGRELVSVNCAAFPETLIEKELFGHERGAFTGAAGAREGLVEMADGGTLFLDEIGEMPVTLQTRLLNVLEERTVRRIGGRLSRPVDFRLVSATNADPEEAIRAHRLREDLYYRLNVVRIHLPPLRERAGDVPALVEHFLDRMVPRPLTISQAEAARLASYPWPGNVRELRNVLEQAVLLREGDLLRPSTFLRGDRAPLPDGGTLPGAPVPAYQAGWPLEVVERRHILAEIDRTGGNLTKAALSLGISLSTLRRRARKMGRPPR